MSSGTEEVDMVNGYLIFLATLVLLSFIAGGISLVRPAISHDDASNDKSKSQLNMFMWILFFLLLLALILPLIILLSHGKSFGGGFSI